MSTMTRILSATTALFAASTLYFAWAVGVERDRGADFSTEHGAFAGAADSRATASENGAAGVTDAEPNETPSAESPGLFDRLSALVGGGRKRAPRQLQNELFQKDFERMFSDAATRRQLVEERIPRYRDQFVVLQRRLDMPSDQWQRFLETMATQAIERRGGWDLCAQDLQCRIRSLGDEAYARYDQEIRDVLGDADMKEFQTFNYALSERQSVESLQAELPLSQQLSEKAAEDLIAALSEVRRDAEKSIQEENGSFRKFSGDDYVVVFPPDLKTLDERLHYAAEHFTKLRDRAAALLNPVQLAAYQRQLKEALRQARRGMASIPELR